MGLTNKQPRLWGQQHRWQRLRYNLHQWAKTQSNEPKFYLQRRYIVELMIRPRSKVPLCLAISKIAHCIGLSITMILVTIATKSSRSSGVDSKMARLRRSSLQVTASLSRESVELTNVFRPMLLLAHTIKKATTLKRAIVCNSSEKDGLLLNRKTQKT